VVQSRTTLGFWLYLMSDCLIFAVLFATFGVLVNNTAGGPAGANCSTCASCSVKRCCC
jgi:cytochrome o ubiquinol oxidase subunit 3